LIIDLEFDQHLGSHKHVINIIMWFRDMGCYNRGGRGKVRRGPKGKEMVAQTELTEGGGKTTAAASFSVVPMAPRRPEWTSGHRCETWAFARSCTRCRRRGENFYRAAPAKTFKRAVASWGRQRRGGGSGAASTWRGREGLDVRRAGGALPVASRTRERQRPVARRRAAWQHGEGSGLRGSETVWADGSGPVRMNNGGLQIFEIF
jgi:hypothetical protein